MTFSKFQSNRIIFTCGLIIKSALSCYPVISLCVFQGVLPGAGEDVPTIVITANYDSYGLAPVSQIKTKKPT